MNFSEYYIITEPKASANNVDLQSCQILHNIILNSSSPIDSFLSCISSRSDWKNFTTFSFINKENAYLNDDYVSFLVENIKNLPLLYSLELDLSKGRFTDIGGKYLLKEFINHQSLIKYHYLFPIQKS